MSLQGVDPPQGNKIIRALNRGGGFPQLQLVPPQGVQGGISPGTLGMLYEDGTLMLYEDNNLVMEYEGSAVPADWFDQSYKHRIPFTVNAGQITGTLTDFPILLKTTSTDMRDNALSTGFDFRVAGTDKVELDYERQFYDGATGEIVAWALLPSATVGTIIYLYYNKPLATDGQNKNPVWANYKFVHHMEDNLIDSTVGGFDFNARTGAAASTPDFVDGQIHRAIELGMMPTQKYLRSQTTTFTIASASDTIVTESWFKGTDAASLHRFQPGIFMAFPWHMNPPTFTNILSWDTGSGDGINSGIPLNDTWHQIVTIWERNKAGDGFRTYIDGAKFLGFRTSVNVPVPTNTGFYQIGGFQDGLELATGIAAEMRFSNTAQSDDYYAAEYNNQNTPSAFYTIDAPGVIQ